MVVCRLSKFIIVKPFYKEKQIIRKGILHAEGKAEGEAEGRLKERLEIARKLKENGFSIADIVRVAGLSAEEIDKL